ncbi:MAG: TRAP transporter large permease [Proteobacteria bacterium]|nr:TRAP transporter large permease [Pseudomonadota bacterium]
MTLYVIGFVLLFLLVLFSGLPVGFGLGVLAIGLLTTIAGPEMALSIGIEKAYASLDTDVLVAIPLFVLAAQLISATGMGKRLFDAAKSFTGGYRSGLGVATIASSGVFSAMTGSSFVSASTMGLIAIPELRKAKYSDTMIAAAITAGGSLGSVIPPSLVMIIYGFLTDESIGRLFMAGMIPGIMLMVFYSIALAVLTRKTDAEKNSDMILPVEDVEPIEVMSKKTALKEAFWGLMAPVIILGGIYLGIFTANEAAAVAVIYCIGIGFVVYRTLTLKSLWEVVMSATTVSAMIALVVIGGGMLAQGAIFGRVPQKILELIILKDLSPNLLLFLVIVFLFVLGMFMESVSLMYLAIPLLHPVVVHVGWDNVWFGVILLINVNLGLITPPMGGVLYIVSQIGAIPFNKVVKGALMPIAVLLLVMFLMILYPPIATWLPSLM